MFPKTIMYNTDKVFWLPGAFASFFEIQFEYI
jgi:hypothetical protein